jgi:hypothetical protein
VLTATIAPARELPDKDDFSPLQLLLSNLNLVVPVAAAVLVTILAAIVICLLRGKGQGPKGECVTATIAPQPELRDKLFPWVPDWLDLNVVVPLAATVVVIFVGIVVICVAISRRSRGPETTRLRGNVTLSLQSTCSFTTHFCVT